MPGKICEDYNKAEDYVDAIKAIFYMLPDPEYGEYDEARQLLETEEQQGEGETSDFIRAYGMEDLTENWGNMSILSCKTIIILGC